MSVLDVHPELQVGEEGLAALLAVCPGQVLPCCLLVIQPGEVRDVKVVAQQRATGEAFPAATTPVLVLPRVCRNSKCMPHQ